MIIMMALVMMMKRKDSTLITCNFSLSAAEMHGCGDISGNGLDDDETYVFCIFDLCSLYTTYVHNLGCLQLM